MSTNDTAAVILSAGLSSRLGRHKAFLPYDQRRDFLSKITSAYLLAGIDRITVVVNAFVIEAAKQSVASLDYNGDIILVTNDAPERGRLRSIQLGLRAAGPCGAVFIQNVDNPFTSVSVIYRMMEARRSDGYVVPSHDGKWGHPVLAGTAVIRGILSVPEQDTSLKELLRPFPCSVLKVKDASVLANINTLRQYQKYFGHAEPL